MPYKVITGIYKITNPSGKIYIGQSESIHSRWNNYKNIERIISQPVLYKSLKKYSYEAHKFEIVEECDFIELNCRERYWQDFYDVLNGGLNCVLTECEDKVKVYSAQSRDKRRHSKIGSKNPNSKDIINIETGVFFDTVQEAAFSVGMNVNYFYDKLAGRSRNQTDIIWCKDYEEGLLPNTLFSPKKYRRAQSYLDGYEVINYLTKEVEGSVRELSKKYLIKESLLRGYMSGVCYNKTDFIYKKDLDAGLTPKTIFKGKKLGEEIIDLHSMEIYKTAKSLSTLLSINNIQLKRGLNMPHCRYKKLSEYIEGFEYDYDINFKFKKDIKYIIHYDTLKIYNTIVEASKDLGVDASTLSKYLSGIGHNKSRLMYLEDYEKGLKPEEIGLDKKRMRPVLDRVTNIEYVSLRKAAKAIGVCSGRLSDMLTGKSKNTTNLIYI